MYVCLRSLMIRARVAQVALCCGVLHCVAVCRNVTHCVAGSVLLCVLLCCNVLQHVALPCTVSRCVAVR